MDHSQGVRDAINPLAIPGITLNRLTSYWYIPLCTFQLNVYFVFVQYSLTLFSRLNKFCYTRINNFSYFLFIFQFKIIDC